MSDQLFYKKVGDQFVAIGKYSEETKFPFGTHLIKIDPFSKTTLYNIDPAVAPLLAAMLYCKEEFITAMMKETSARPRSTPITKKQQAAWTTFSDTMKESLSMIEYQSADEIAKKTIMSLQLKVDEMMTNTAVKNAYDNFLILAKLSYAK